MWLSEKLQKAKLQTSSEMVLSISWKIDSLATINSRVFGEPLEEEVP